jgi:uncharacterized protein with PIN domain
MISEEAHQTVEVAKVALSLEEALMQTLKAAGAGRVLVYVKCPVTGAHHFLGRLTRVRGPFHAVPLTILYKRSLGRGKGFGTIAESPLVPTGVYLKVRGILKKYVGFASGIKGFSESRTRCFACDSVIAPVLEKVRFKDGRVRFHLSFLCPKCGRMNRPWTWHYVVRFTWLVRKAKTVKVLRAGGLRCRRCGDRAVRARVNKGDGFESSSTEEDYNFVLRCGSCGFTVGPPAFRRSDVANEVVESENAQP